jgi:hypothetical protein
MTSIEQVLDDRAKDFAHALTDVGFSDVEAERFVEEAGPALVRSYRWHTASLGAMPFTREDAREVLGGMPGRALAHKVGLPEQKTWDGLRHFVPAVLRASSLTCAGLGHRPSRDRSSRVSEVARFDVGFGLTLDWLTVRKDAADVSDDGEPSDEKASGVLHPIFARLLSLQR